MNILLLLVLSIYPYTPYEKKVEVICLNKDMKYAERYVQKEVEKRFDDAVVYLVHGAYDEDGVWSIVPDPKYTRYIPMQDLVDVARKNGVKKDIVLWSCNERGADLIGEDVYYFRSLVWAMPDNVEDVCYPIHENEINKGNAGSIKEAVEGKKR